MAETFKTVKNFPNYKVSSNGRVITKSSGLVRKQRSDRDGYKVLDLKLNGVRKTVKVHRLVKEHFGGLHDVKNQVNHVKGNKDDNRASSLCNVTPRENSQHAHDSGLYGRYTRVKKHYRKRKNGCTFVVQHKRKNKNGTNKR